MEGIERELKDMVNIIIIIIIAALVAASSTYMIREKKKGRTCIGCSNADFCNQGGHCEEAAKNTKGPS